MRIIFFLCLLNTGCGEGGVPSGTDLAPEPPEECPKALQIFDIQSGTTTTEAVSGYPAITFGSVESARYLGLLIAPLRIAARCTDITLTATTFTVTVTPMPDTLSSTFSFQMQRGGEKVDRLSGIGGSAETSGFAWRTNLRVVHGEPVEVALVCVGKCEEALYRRRIEVCLGGADWDMWLTPDSPREYALQKPGTDCYVQNL